MLQKWSQPILPYFSTMVLLLLVGWINFSSLFVGHANLTEARFSDDAHWCIFDNFHPVYHAKPSLHLLFSQIDIFEAIMWSISKGHSFNYLIPMYPFDSWSLKFLPQKSKQISEWPPLVYKLRIVAGTIRWLRTK